MAGRTAGGAPRRYHLRTSLKSTNIVGIQGSRSHAHGPIPQRTTLPTSKVGLSRWNNRLRPDARSGGNRGVLGLERGV